MDGLIGAAVESGAPIDITSQPALWGGMLRGTAATLVIVGNADHERATDEDHASSLVQANLIEILSSVGREFIDVYYLRVRQSVQEFQISGVLNALELAKQDGYIRHVGLCCDGSALAALGMWQFHDAFETLLVPRNHLDAHAYSTLAPMAKSRRVGVVTSRPLNWGDGRCFTDAAEHWRLRNLTQSFYGYTLPQAVICDLAREHPVMVGVRSARQVEQAVASPDIDLKDGLDAMLQPFKETFRSLRGGA